MYKKKTFNEDTVMIDVSSSPSKRDQTLFSFSVEPSNLCLNWNGQNRYFSSLHTFSYAIECMQEYIKNREFFFNFYQR